MLIIFIYETLATNMFFCNNLFQVFEVWLKVLKQTLVQGILEILILNVLMVVYKNNDALDIDKNNNLSNYPPNGNSRHRKQDDAL